MKYRLKKDLPFAKAGTILSIDIDKLNAKGYASYQDGRLIWWLNDTSDIGYLSTNGWIEEVKPREWILEIDTALNGEVSHAVRPANAKGRMLHKDSEIIKVKEVIE